jgi:hypothetical protein
LRELAERRVHLRGGALEEAPASAGEERVAAKHRVGTEERDVARRVAGNVERGELDAEARHLESVALGEAPVDARGHLARGTEGGTFPAPYQIRDPPDMVRMVVCREDGR